MEMSEVAGLKKGLQIWAIILAPSEDYQILIGTNFNLHYELQWKLR